MEPENPKKFDRIVATLIQLQSRRVVRAQDLADRFRVSLRTVYRDIRTLEAAGVPIASEAGVGYSLMEGYHLPPVLFTREEAGSFVAAEKLMQQFTQTSLGDHFESAMYKVRAVLRNRDKAWVESLENQIRIAPGVRQFREDLPEAPGVLFEAIAEQRQVMLRYKSIEADTPVQRRIEPVGLFHENGFWYVYGYCHLRADYRQFRTDRIEGISRTDQGFTRGHAPLDDFLEGRDQGEKVRVRLRMDRRVARYLGNARYRYGFVSEKPAGEQVELTFLTPWLESDFARWYLMFGDYAEIIEPARLRVRVGELLQAQLGRLNSGPA